MDRLESNSFLTFSPVAAGRLTDWVCSPASRLAGAPLPCRPRHHLHRRSNLTLRNRPFPEDSSSSAKFQFGITGTSLHFASLITLLRLRLIYPLVRRLDNSVIGIINFPIGCVIAKWSAVSFGWTDRIARQRFLEWDRIQNHILNPWPFSVQVARRRKCFRL